jgi:LysM repeat protein
VIRPATLALGLALAITLAAAPRASAGGETVTYKVVQGDSLKMVAAEFYGDRDHYVFIMTANKMDHPRMLKPGEKLKIPINRDVTTTPGQTFDKLARDYLDDERRAKALAEFNGMDARDTIPAGTLLTIPLSVTHVAAGNETLAQIAASYFGDPKQAALLRDYNFLDKDALTKGESVEVPIRHVRVRLAKAPPIDAESKARSETLDATRAQVKAALPRARKARQAADYAGVKAELAGIDLDYVDADVAVEVGLLLGEATIAFDDMPFTLATFKRVIARKPGLVLDGYHYSPKVRDAWKKAGGAVDGDK